MCNHDAKMYCSANCWRVRCPHPDTHSHAFPFTSVSCQPTLFMCLFVIRISILPFQCLHATQVGLQQLKPIIKYNDNHTKITIG